MTETPTKIADRFRVIESLGKGGIGEVFKAEDELLKKVVAIKTLQIGSSEDAKVRFQREAQVIGKLAHRGIVSASDFGITSDGSPYLVIDYLEGITLAELLRNEGALTAGDALVVAIQIAEALEFAHSRGVLHRDIKPSNIMLMDWTTEEPSIRLLDFGLAKVLSENQQLTDAGVALGSPLYMSPEQVLAGQVDTRSDIYSLGCVIFEMLTGKPPIRGETALETVQLKTSDVAPRLSELADTGSFQETLDDLIARCLEIDPDRRYQSVEELQRDLEEIIQSIEHEDEEAFSAGDALEDVELTAEKRVTFGWMHIAIVVAASLSAIWLFLRMQSPTSVDEPAAQLIKRKIQHKAKIDSNIDLNRMLKEIPEGNTEPLVITGNDFEPKDKLSPSQMRRINNALLQANHQNLEVNMMDLRQGSARTLDYDQLQVLTLRSCDIDEQLLREIWRLRSLKRLLIRNPTLDTQGASFDGISNLYQLVYLDLSGNEISNEALKSISKLKQLKFLDLRDCEGFDAMGIKYLQALPEIDKILLGGRDFKPEYAAMLKEFQTLTALELQEIQNPEETLERIVGLNGLSQLALRHISFKPGERMKLGKFSRLTRLALTGVRTDDPQLFDNLGTLKELSALAIDKCTLPAKAWVELLDRLTSVRSLSLTNMSNIPDTTWEQLPNLKSVRVLDLDGSRIPPQAWTCITSMDSLQELVVSSLRLIPLEAKKNLEKKKVDVNIGAVSPVSL